MVDEILYMGIVVLAGFAVNFGLRALPFLIFAGRDRELPVWLSKIGRYISPVIIGALIIYSYSGLEWRTLWPYLAGLVTILLHLWKGNPLISIIVGTILYMCFMNYGCVSKRVLEMDRKHPAVSVTRMGVKFGNEFVKPEEVVDILEDYGIPHDRVIHILREPDVVDLRPARYLMACLAKAGYTRPVLVTKEHAESMVVPKKAPQVYKHR